MASERLLKRKPINIDSVRTSTAIANKTILVTGAGGSIGSALCRRIAQFGPARLILLDKSEHGLYQITLDLTTQNSAEPNGRRGARSSRRRTQPGDGSAPKEPAPTEAERSLIPVLGDLCDSGFLERVFDNHHIDVVFHTAAYKHVSLLEYQPHAAIRNNVIGTDRLVDAVVTHGVPRLVMLSTDKAVNPTSIMGASKRIAEMAIMGMSTADSRMTAIRLGNVLGSQGSVMPRFAEQIQEHKPLTVTDPKAARYFMTPDEAVGLVLASAWLGKGADLLVPDVGEPVLIVDLAQEMIRAAGFPDAQIVFTGLAPGEKLAEEMLRKDERAVRIAGTAVRRVADVKMPGWEVGKYIAELDKAAQNADAEALISMVSWVLPEYRPSRVLEADPRAQDRRVGTDELCR